MDPIQLQAALANPIVSLPTFFHRDGQQDLVSLRQTVDYLIDHGFVTLLLTAGDSNYELQSEAEIRTVVRTVVDAAAGRATVVVGTALNWWLEQIHDFASFVDELGAAVMVLRPSACLGSGPAFEDPVFELYRTVGERVRCGIVLNGQFSMGLLDRLADLPGVVGLKEDAGDAWCHDALYTVGDRLSVFNGGQKWRFLYGVLWGMKGYMTSFGPWAPEVSQRFWAAVQRQDLFAAARIVDTYDNPFFAYSIHHPKGFRPVRQASFEIFGRGPRWLRAPQPSLDEDEVTALRSVFAGMDLL
jgi:dihydrodipicolinate synthase/N-acetylneuraminate lyase